MAETDTDPGTTGHEWDGIREFNNPLPRWWVWVFLVCIIWSIGYWILMPAWPTGGSAENGDYTKGLLGYSQRASVARSLELAKGEQKVFLDKIAAMEVSAIAADPELATFATAGGGSAFLVNCSQCHGTGAAGSVGYPNLNDDDWIWGGKVEDIAATIRYGIRSGHDETRDSEMPGFLRDEILTKAQIEDIATYVLSLSGGQADPAVVDRAKPVFEENCASCHGEDGKGDREFGSPNLTDRIWLFGGDRASIVSIISNSRKGIMPAWEGRLAPETIKMLAVYVHGLGGGER